jgi:hypothetical protein
VVETYRLTVSPMLTLVGAAYASIALSGPNGRSTPQLAVPGHVFSATIAFVARYALMQVGVGVAVGVGVDRMMDAARCVADW